MFCPLLALGLACEAEPREREPAAPPSLTERCEAGEGEACVLIAVDLRERGGSPELTWPWLVRGCDAGHPDACVELEGALERGCAARSGPACASLGHLELERSAPTQARQAFHRGCALESADSCHALAVIFRQGQGVEVDQAYAARQFARACALGQSESCEELLGSSPPLAAPSSPDPTRR